MKSKIALATLMALSLTSLNAMATNTGKVTISGVIQDSPCILEPGQNGEDVKVDFGNVSMAKLNANGEESRKFELKLKDCDLAGQVASIRFDSTQANATNTLMEATGSSSGVGIGITGYTFGTAAAVPQVLQDGDNVLEFTTVAKKAVQANDVTAGTFQAITNFTITYA